MREPPKLLNPSHVEEQPFIKAQDLLDGHGEPTAGLYKTGRTLEGKPVMWKNVGRFLAKINKQTGEYMPDDIHQGWMIGTGRWINSEHNVVSPTAQKQTWVLHHRNRFSSDINNNAHLVLLNPKFLAFLYKHSGSDKDWFFAADGGKRDGALKYMQHILLQNLFMAENRDELRRLHSALEKNALSIVLPDINREHEDLERFQPSNPFVNVRVEQDGTFEQGMYDDVLRHAYHSDKR